MAIYLRDNSDPYRAFVEEDFNRVDEREGELNNLNLGLGLLGAAVAGAAATPLVRSLLKNRIRKESPVSSTTPPPSRDPFTGQIPTEPTGPQGPGPTSPKRPSSGGSSGINLVDLSASLPPSTLLSRDVSDPIKRRAFLNSMFKSPEDLPPVSRPLGDSAVDLIELVDTNTGEILKFVPGGQDFPTQPTDKGVVTGQVNSLLKGEDLTSVEIQQLQNPVVSDHSLNAVGSSEDQVTGRVLRSVQRDEDRDLSAVSSDVFESRRLELADEGLLPSEIEKKLARETAVKHAAEL